MSPSEPGRGWAEPLSRANRFSVGLEEGSAGAIRVHALDLPGCTTEGPTPDRALDAFAASLAAWLRFLADCGEAVPSPDRELEIAVDEWIRTDAAVAEGSSDVCFAADRVPLGDTEIAVALRRLGDLRGRLLARIRPFRGVELERVKKGEWYLPRVLNELARAQWWTLTRLGASPLGEVPERTLNRLDTAMALVVQRFTELDPEARATSLELEGEEWTPRKVLRRLLWLEWSLGQVAQELLSPD